MNTAFETEKTGKHKDEWLTPPEIIKALGPFDLDPCAPVNRPWPTATRHLTNATPEDDGLLADWGDPTQFVWCNPPYDNKVCGAFLKRMACHNNGIVLIFARTETDNWHRYIWPRASGVIFIRGRLSFHHVDGTKGGTAGAPSALVSYGLTAQAKLVQAVAAATIPGKFIINP